jgi:deoxyribonuclease-1-like protein
MALFKRRTAQRFFFRAASSGLPWPLRSIVRMRIISRILLMAVPLLIGAGVLTLDWSNGWPSFSVDKKRAAEISDVAKDVAKNVADRVPDDFKEKVRESIPDGLSLDRWIPETTPVSTAAAPAAMSRKPTETIRIASFNIQVLGSSKARKPEVMNVLANVIRRYDVVAIQELRTKDAWVMENLVALVNSSGSDYRYLVGPRLGRTNSKEQYVFVYDAARIDADPQSLLTVPDPQDYLHRQPTIARFQVRSDSTQPGFSFILANIHTDPDETKTELNALDDVFVSLQRNQWQEDDVILLGDLNVSYRKLGELGQLPNIAYTVRGEPTNTRGTKSYDNIVFDRLATKEFSGVTGILSLQQEFGLSMDDALAVSDHWPVWAEFDAKEAGIRGPLASRSSVPSAGRGRARVVENPLLRLRGVQR